MARTRLKRKIRKVSSSRSQGLLGQNQAQEENKKCEIETMTVPRFSPFFSHVCMHARTLARSLVFSHAYTHSSTLTHSFSRMHACTHARSLVFSLACIHADSFSRKDACTHARSHFFTFSPRISTIFSAWRRGKRAPRRRRRRRRHR